jgi:hypothetical protein
MKNFVVLFLVLGITALFSGCSENFTSAPDVNQVNQSLTKGLPADGNGNKEVVELADSWTTDCGLEADMTGWVQIKLFGSENNRNLEIDLWNVVVTYTNSEGEKFIWHDLGPDHYYMVGDELYVSVTGRASGSGFIGHVVFNISQGEPVHISGKEFGDLDAYACSMLN